ncbi:MAG: outer membrane protein assembly factor BamA, partial [Bacteroidota bacterium]
MRHSVLLLCFFTLLGTGVRAQVDTLNLPVFDYSSPQEYEIGAIGVKGAFFAEQNAIIGVTGLSVGDKIRIPGPDIPRAIRNLWRLRLFTDVSIEQDKAIGDVIFLTVRVAERPRFLRHSYKGVKQGLHEDLNEVINGHIVRGGIVTEDSKVKAAEGVREFFVEKGYLDALVQVEEIVDSSRANSVRLVFDVNRGDRVKIKEINFVGNDAVKDKKLRKQMKET